MAGSSSTQRLLVFDDDESVNRTICTIAESAGFETSSVSQGDDFFQQVVSWQPSHLVIDLQLPDIDGVEALRQLARIGSSSIVIITSGLESRVLEAAARIATENGLRVSGVLPKPFTPGRLRALLSDEGDSAGAKPFISGSGDVRISSAEFTELSTAISNEQFQPHYQPKISCETGELVGFECLARWYHPKNGIIMPDRFIPLAERSGLINQLTRQIVTRSLAWYNEHFPADSDVKIAINLSAKLLADAGFPRWLMDECASFSIDPRHIILEITETSSLANPVVMLEFLTQLRIKGFSLSIDDFGVGYSSLIQLARLPFSEMKIDKMFVMSAPRSLESQKIAAAIVGLARALGLYVTAEGLEDEWTLGFLRNIGCDAAQGYFIAKPLDGETAIKWVQSR